MPRGGKPMFDNPRLLSRKIDEYFTACAAPTLSGLAMHLVVNRKTLTRYIADYETGQGNRGKGKAAKCGYLLSMAKARIEAWLEEQLLTRSKTHGIEMILKNCYGWGNTGTGVVKVEGEVTHKTSIDEEKETPLSQISDEELLEQLKIVNARVAEIMEREVLSL